MARQFKSVNNNKKRKLTRLRKLIRVVYHPEFWVGDPTGKNRVGWCTNFWVKKDEEELIYGDEKNYDNIRRTEIDLKSKIEW